MPSVYTPKDVEEVTVYCPQCCALETVTIRGYRLVKTQKWRQYHGKIYHCDRPCTIFRSMH